MPKWWTSTPAPRWTGWALIVGGGAFAAAFAIVGIFGLLEIGDGGLSMMLLAFLLMGYGFIRAHTGYQILRERDQRAVSLQEHFGKGKPTKGATSDAAMEGLNAASGAQADGDDGDIADVSGGDDGGADDWD